MTVRGKLFTAMAVLVFLMGLAFILSTQGFLRETLPALFSAAQQTSPSMLFQLEERVYNEMIHLAFKFVAALSVITLVIGFWLSRKLTSPLRRLITAIERVGKGDLDFTLPITSRDEYGKVTEALNRMTADLSRSEEMRRHLVADVAHELRTPLTILQGQLDLIQQSGEPVMPAKLLPMQDELIRLTKLVSDLQQLSLAEAGKLTLDKKPTDISELLDRLTEMLRLETEEKGVNLIWHPKVNNAVIAADSHRITQVFYNLIGNAIRYTPAQGQVSIRLSAEQAATEGGEVVVCIEDTGIGISAEHLPHLFDRFYRVEDDRSRHSGGTGLGLAIARQFVEAHGGRIEVESQIGRGTTFTVFLPRNV
jgi:two-component system, OmpR family, sensor histidine kinase BaeS